MKAVDVVPGIEYRASIVNHSKLREQVILVRKVLILHGLVEPFDSPILLGAVGIGEVMRNPCVLQFLVKMQEIFAPIVGVDRSNGKREGTHKPPDKIPC